MPPTPADTPDTATLATLLEREESLRDVALQSLQHAQDQHARAEHQCEHLVGYRADYIERWSAQFKGQAPIEIVQCYAGFMQRLDQAIAQQRAVLARAAEGVAAARRTLVEAEQRVAAVGKLIERRVADHRRHLDRREQRQVDEARTRPPWPGHTRAGPLT
jgi:flagellar FliJ protein